MSENKPLQLLYAYRLKWRDLTNLSQVEKAALTGVFFCDNEVNSLRRLCRLSMFWIEDNETIHRAAEIQRNMLLRTLTGRLFEFLALYNEISSKGRTSAKLVGVIGSLKDAHRECRKHPGFRIAEKIRNSQAHHYSLDAIGQLVDRHGADSKLDFNFSPESDNAFAPFAEALVFNPDPQGRLEEELPELVAEELVNDWINWTHAATDLLRSLRDSLVEALVAPEIPKMRPQFRTEFLAPDLKVEETARLPLFLQASK